MHICTRIPHIHKRPSASTAIHSHHLLPDYALHRLRETALEELFPILWVHKRHGLLVEVHSQFAMASGLAQPLANASLLSTAVVVDVAASSFMVVAAVVFQY